MKGLKTITLRERAAVMLYIEGAIKSKPDLYRVAYAGSSTEVESLADISATATRWFSSKKIQEFLASQKAICEEKRRKERKVIEAEILAHVPDKQKDASSRIVDYSNPENQRKKLNELVNSASDPGEALDALKVIISGQRDDKQAAREQRQVRAYLPLMCDECPLYIREKSKITK